MKLISAGIQELLVMLIAALVGYGAGNQKIPKDNALSTSWGNQQRRCTTGKL